MQALNAHLTRKKSLGSTSVMSSSLRFSNWCTSMTPAIPPPMTTTLLRVLFPGMLPLSSFK